MHNDLLSRSTVSDQSLSFRRVWVFGPLPKRVLGIDFDKIFAACRERNPFAHDGTFSSVTASILSQFTHTIAFVAYKAVVDNRFGKIVLRLELREITGVL